MIINYIFLCPHLLKQQWAYSISLWYYVGACLHVCHVCNQCQTFTAYIQIYIHIYACISLGEYNMGPFYAMKLKFAMLLNQI